MFRIVDAGKVENGLAKLRDLQENEMYDFWTEPSTKVATDVLVPETRLEEFEEYMKNEGFTYSVMIEDLGKLILAEKMANKQGKAMDWENYQRYETVKAHSSSIFYLMNGNSKNKHRCFLYFQRLLTL